MKKQNLFITIFIAVICVVLIVQDVNGQCPTITCPSNITVNNDPGDCDAVVTFTPPVGTNPCGAGTATFNFTGAVQTWTVPAGITAISIDAYGAQGINGVQGNFDGSYLSTFGGTGGLGGYANGGLSVTPGQTIYLYVGGQNGWNGGGTTGSGFGAGGGNGGGASDIRINGTNLTDRVLVAAGGGGGGGGALNQICSPGIPSDGGAGSGGGSNLNGGTGTSGGSGPGVGIGGYASGLGGAGGAGNQSGTAGTNGTLGLGGNGGGTTYLVPPYATGVTGRGGGGGGGYNGGGGGGASGYNGGCGAPGGGGAGGSSYTGGVTGGSATASVKSGNGQIIISWPGGPTTTNLIAGLPSGSTFPHGVTTETYTVTDQLSNTATCSFTITVNDNEVPVPDIATLPNVTGGCSATATAPTATDNCTGTVTGTTTDPLTYNTQGTYTIHWTYSDSHGNSTTQNQTVIVDDVTNPVTPTLSVLTGECSVTATAPSTTDNCAGTITGTTTDPLTYNSQGTFTIHWTFSDGNGNSTTANQTVIVDDVTNPVTPTLSVLTGECSVTATAPSTTDNCAGTITGTTTDPLTYNSQGTFTIQWTFSDGNGNSSTANQTVIVDDVTNPVTPTLSVLTGECSVTATAPSTTDNCAGTITGTTTDPLTYNSQGTFTIQWTFSDGNGNSTTANQTVIVDDVTNPVTPTLSVLTGECSVTATAPSTTDNCAGTITGTTTDPLTYNSQGTFTIHWTFSDGNGNSTTANQTVIVDDVTNPVTPTLSVLTGECSVTATAPSTTDNCAGTITGTTTDPLTYNSQGTYTIQWTFSDGNGNSTTANQTVIVDDITPPTFSCPSDAVACIYDPLSIAPSAITDNCGGIVTVTYTLTGATTGGGTDDASNALFNAGGTLVEYFFNDGNGNIDSCSVSVTINAVDTSLTVSDPDITANATGASYQWLDCENAFAIIPGATSQTFNAIANGHYAVEITQGSCTDTSACVQILTIGITSVQTEVLSIYPNPVSDELIIELKGNQKELYFEIFNSIGQVVFKGNVVEKAIVNTSNFDPGVYYVRAKLNESSVIRKVIKL